MNTKGGAIPIAMPIGIGLVSTSALLLLYFGLLSALSGWSFTLAQFALYWPFIIALAVGFGIQVGLFLFLRQAVHGATQTGKVVAVTGTTSGAAMLSCCTHYLVNLLPILGVTGLVSLVGQYQVELFWFGIASNLAGIAFMSYRLMAFSRARNAAGALASLLFLAGIALAAPAIAAEDSLTVQESFEGGVSVTVKPLSLTAEEPWRFKVELNTHSVALDQDMVSNVVVLMEDGNEVAPQAWEGDPPGGHHRSGTLVFAPLSPKPETVTIKIRDIAVPERVFSWPNPSP